ncbi:hyoothetical protein [Hirsutella rhossiliensis]
MAADFDKRSYWHERFTSETSFEWLLSSRAFMSLLQLHLDRLDPYLHNHLRRRGFLDVTNLDYEPLAAQRGRQLEDAAFDGDVKMRYVLADATQLSPGRNLGAHSMFDLVIDKSTFDAVSCGGESPFLRMAHGIKAYMAPGAVWLSLSYSSSGFNVERLPFDVEVMAKLHTPKRKATDPDIYHWCYCLRPK